MQTGKKFYIGVVEEQKKKKKKQQRFNERECF